MIGASSRSPEILAEEYVPDREFLVRPCCGEEALPVVEIVSTDEFYSYDAKYKPGGSRHLIPAPIDHDSHVAAANAGAIGAPAHRLAGLLRAPTSS